MAGAADQGRRAQKGDPPIDQHRTRNTTLTLQLEAGVDAHVVDSTVGHSDVAVTRGKTTDNSANLAPQFMEQIVSQLPLARMGTPDDLVGLCLFLLSEEAADITGVLLPVDGGRTA